MILLSLAMLAQTTDPQMAMPAAPAAAKAKPPKVKKICRDSVDTGSIMPAHVCHTAAEWQSIDAANPDLTPGLGAPGRNAADRPRG